MFPQWTLPARIVWVNVNGLRAWRQCASFSADHGALTDRSTAIRAKRARQLPRSVLTATEDLPNWIWAFDPSLRSVAFDPSSARSRCAVPVGSGPDGIARRRRAAVTVAVDVDSAAGTAQSLLVQEALQIGIEI
jgi:hypothetical protein